MSIGKSAIKRVENNGYSKVKTSAPDMLNSHVIAAPSQEVAEKIIAPLEEKSAKKKPSNRSKKNSPKKEVLTPSAKKDIVSVACGEDLPYYLL